MSVELLGSRVIVVEEDPKVRLLQGAPSDVAVFVGVTEKGPVATSTTVKSDSEFDKVFGGYTTNTLDMRSNVRGFFDEGGKEAVIVRVVHYDGGVKQSAAATINLATATASATAGAVTSTAVAPFNLEPADTIVGAIDGAANATATFNAAAASRVSAAQTYALSNGHTLTVKIDGGGVQTITFLTANFANIAAATAAEVAAVINAQLVGGSATAGDVLYVGIAVTITSDKRGTGSSVEVTGGTGNGALGFSIVAAAGTGNVANIDAVTGNEVKTVVEAAIAGCTVTANGNGTVTITSDTTGVNSSVNIAASSTADDEIGLDNATHTGTSGAAVNTLKVDAKYDGTYGNELKIKVLPATSGKSDEFNLYVLRNDITVESWANVSMTDASDRYVETIINNAILGSFRIKVTDLDAAPADPRPRGAADVVGYTSALMTGGSNGITDIAPADYTGSDTSAIGIRALDQTQDISILCLPGRFAYAEHAAMWTYCEVTRNRAMISILDAEADLTAQQIANYASTGDKNGAGSTPLKQASEHAALYWPRVKVTNPSKSIYGNADTVIIPPAGLIAGLYARMSRSGPVGYSEHPAGRQNGLLTTVVGLETEEVIDPKKVDIIFPENVNPILRTKKGGRFYVDGARTLKDNGNFPSVGERRTAIKCTVTITEFLDNEVRQKKHTTEQRANASQVVEEWLSAQSVAGAFRSTDPSKAFFFDFSDELNPPSEVLAKRANARLGLATAPPIEWIILKVGQDTRDLDAEIQRALA